MCARIFAHMEHDKQSLCFPVSCPPAAHVSPLWPADAGNSSCKKHLWHRIPVPSSGGAILRLNRPFSKRAASRRLSAASKLVKLVVTCHVLCMFGLSVNDLGFSFAICFVSMSRMQHRSLLCFETSCVSVALSLGFLASCSIFTM